MRYKYYCFIEYLILNNSHTYLYNTDVGFTVSGK